MRLSLALALTVALCANADVQADPSIRSDLEQWLGKQQSDGVVAAASFAVVSADGIDSGGVGHRNGVDGAQPDADTQFQIGSISKVFTNLLLAERVASGKLRYDTAIGSLLPDNVTPRNPAVAKITLEQLATHRSGLPRLPANLDLSNTVDPYAGYDAAKLHAGIVNARDRQPLGKFYTYSNFGVGLLGHLLGSAAGRGYHAAVIESVVAPLALQNTAFEPGANAATPISGGKPVTPWGFTDSLAAAGALWGSVNDLARLTQAYFGGHAHDLAHPLANDLEVVADAGDFEVTRVWHVARAGGVPVYWHNGGTAGFHSFVGFRTDTAQAVAILVSGDADPTNVGLRALGVQPIEPKPRAIDREIFGQYTLSPQFGLGVFEQDGALVVQATGQPSFALHAVGDDAYALGEVDASLRFLREDGKVTAVELIQNGAVNRAPRTSTTATIAAQSEVRLEAEQLPDYVGAFEFAPGAVLTVKVVDAGLQAQLSGQPFFPVFAKGDDRFFYKVVDAELQFERDAAGKVVAVVLHQSGIEQRAKRVRN